jgi:hypothetical protein
MIEEMLNGRKEGLKSILNGIFGCLVSKRRKKE